MGTTSFDPVDYQAAAKTLQSTGQTFKRSATASSTGNYSASSIAPQLNPRNLKNGRRECCFAPGFNDSLGLIVSLDGTASMNDVPHEIQKALPGLITLITEQGVSDHPNILFMCHDDEEAIAPDAVFQMSEFEAGAAELLTSLNEMIIPGNGGGNNGEAYNLSIYAAAFHTRLESTERDADDKGFFFLIGDEEPYYRNGDPTIYGTSRSVAKELFGDDNEKDVSMLESLKKLAERYYVYIIRPGHTSHGKDKSITKAWQNLLKAAGIDTEHVLEISETEAIIPTISLTVGGVLGADRDDMIDVLRAQGGAGVDSAAKATMAIVPVKAGAVQSSVTTALATTDGEPAGGRTRRSSAAV